MKSPTPPRRFPRPVGPIAPISLALALVFPAALAETPKYTIQEVMEALHKGQVNVGKRVLSGEGSDDDIKKLVAYYPSLALQAPPKGDEKEWKERTSKLIEAAKALEASRPGALDQYKAAANCKACHTAHRPD